MYPLHIDKGLSIEDAAELLLKFSESLGEVPFEFLDVYERAEIAKLVEGHPRLLEWITSLARFQDYTVIKKGLFTAPNTLDGKIASLFKVSFDYLKSRSGNGLILVRILESFNNLYATTEELYAAFGEENENQNASLGIEELIEAGLLKLVTEMTDKRKYRFHSITIAAGRELNVEPNGGMLGVHQRLARFYESKFKQRFEHLSIPQSLEELSFAIRAIEHSIFALDPEKAIEIMQYNQFTGKSKRHLSIYELIMRLGGNEIRYDLSENILKITDREKLPKLWATSMVYLGNALMHTQDNRKQCIEKAIECYESSLEVFTRDDYPIEWGQSQHFLGNAHEWLQGKYGLERNEPDDKERKIKRQKIIERSIEFYNKSLETITRENAPDSWALTQKGLGNAYRLIVDLHANHKEMKIKLDIYSKRQLINKALNHVKNASTVFTKDYFDFRWAQTQYSFGQCYRFNPNGYRRWENDLKISREYFERSLEVFTETQYPINYGLCMYNIGLTLELSGRDKTDKEKTGIFPLAIPYYEEAIRVFKGINASGYLKNSEDHIKKIEDFMKTQNDIIK